MARNKGLGSSASKLSELGFDPIVMMLDQYKRLLYELDIQEQIRDKKLVRLSQKGTPLAYNFDGHMALIERTANLAEKLLKYGYAPVKDGEEDVNTPTLNIMLSDQGAVFQLNPKREEDTE